MALIICTECGKEYSDKAACPNCAMQTNDTTTSGNERQMPTEDTKKLSALPIPYIFCGLFSIVNGVFIIFSSTLTINIFGVIISTTSWLWVLLSAPMIAFGLFSVVKGIVEIRTCKE